MAVEAKSLLSSAKMGAKLSPQRMAVEIAAKPLRQIAKLNAMALGALALWALSMGKAVFTGFVIGATVGGTAGAVAGVVIPVAALGPFGLLLTPITVPLMATTGAIVGGVAGGFIGYGMASGSTTAITTGVGAGVGGTVGAYVGYVAGSFIGATTAGFLVAGCAALFAPCAALAPIVIPVGGMVGGLIGATVGAYIGAAIGAAVGYAVGKLVATIGVPASGALAGAGAGFIVGGPVGAVVGAGIGYFSAGGWGQVKQVAGAAGGAPVGAAGGVAGWISGAASTVGSFVAGAVSTVGGVISSAAGGFFGTVTGAANFVVGQLGAATSAVAASGPVMLAVGGTVAGVTTLGVLNQVNTATSFFSPQQDAVIGGTGDNELFTLVKQVNPDRLGNQNLPTDLNYNIYLKAKSNIKIESASDKLEVQGKNGSFTITQDKEGNSLPPPPCETPETVAAGDTWGCRFTVTIANSQNRNFADSVVTNTITITASKEGSAPFTDSDFAITTIGAPPTDCPHGWPTSHGSITQGPSAKISDTIGHYYLLVKYGEQAIDIGDNRAGTSTFATFNGRVYSVQPDEWNGGYGKTVEVEGKCGTTYFRARWSHLESFDPAIRVGAIVQFGQRIGAIDATGLNIGGDHLHYSLFGLDIILYVPEEFPLDCLDAACGVSW